MSIFTKTPKTDTPRDIESLLATIRPTKEHPELCAAVALLQKLRGQLQTLEGGIGDIRYTGEVVPQPQGSPEADAGALLDSGGDLSVLAGQPSQVQARDIALRQLAALRIACQQQEVRVTETEAKIIREGMDQIRPVCEQIVGDMIGAAEQYLAAIRRADEFFTGLSRKGYRADVRGGEWTLWPWESIALRGGDLHARGTLENYIRQRKQSVGIERK